MIFKVFASGALLTLAFLGAILGLDKLFPFLEQWHPSLSFGLLYGAQILGFFLPLWFFYLRREKPTLKDFGWVKASFREILIVVLGTYFLYLFCLSALLSAMESFQVQLPGFEGQAPFLPLFGEDLIGKSVAFLIIVILAPILEEFLFRGFLYKRLLTRWKMLPASLFSALLFACLHFEFSSIFPLFFLGLVLNAIYSRTGSLKGCLAFHVLNNLIAFTVSITL